ncbi:isoprenylcysteine carboxylmethyltransferase family protein [uncultured Algoriphagus sp.]|uniref:methyltransferase family protein n=1 Tax=uncultured Algoriphagus sp. TaxID=417365 RepID=UPI002593993C|nr:isoprenylcysteine carboxylmethyltransferase family protein [uncultured Algoriphagus sp.]
MLTLLWAVFYVSHSSLASVKVKRFLEEHSPRLMKRYRLYYSILSLTLFAGILYHSVTIPVLQLFPTSPIITYVGYMLATFGTIILVKSSRAISLSGFFGISTPKKEKLVISGIYSKVRHPLYAALILIFLGYAFVAASLAAIIHLFCLLVYLIFGIKFEEQNLTQLFGKDYIKYKESVPALIPKWK